MNRNHLCYFCCVRFRQKAGLCRTCGRAAGIYPLTPRERRTVRIERMLAHGRPVRAPEPVVSTPVLYQRQIDGRTYDVVWNG